MPTYSFRVGKSPAADIGGQDEVSQDIQLHRMRIQAPVAGDAQHDRLVHVGRAHRGQSHQQHGPRGRQLPHAQRRHRPGERKPFLPYVKVPVQVIAYVSITMSPKEWSKNTFGWARAEVTTWVATVSLSTFYNCNSLLLSITVCYPLSISTLTSISTI